MCMRHRGLAPVVQPTLHETNLIALRRFNAPRDFDKLWPVGSTFHQIGHFQCLLVVRNHHLHEAHIRGGITGVGNLDRLLSR